MNWFMFKRNTLIILLLSFITSSVFAQEYVFKWNFESAPKDWKFKNNSQYKQLPVSWFTGMSDPNDYCGKTPFGSASSYMCTGFTPYDRSGSTLSKWMISPVLEVQNGDKISFYLTAAYVDCIFGQRPNRLIVRMSTNESETKEPNVGTIPGQFGDFNILLEDINPNYETASILSPSAGIPHSVWKRREYTISGLPANKKVKVRIGFNYFIENAGDEGCGDQIEIPGGAAAQLAVDLAAELADTPRPNDVVKFGGALVTLLTYNGGNRGTYIGIDEFIHNPIDVYVSNGKSKEIFNTATAGNTPSDSAGTTMYKNLSCGFGQVGKPGGREFYVHNYGGVMTPTYHLSGANASMFKINDNLLTGPQVTGTKRPFYVHFDPPANTPAGDYTATVTVTTTNPSFPIFSFNVKATAYSQNQPPTVYCHDSITVALDANGTASITLNDIYRFANDDCSNWDQWTISMSGDVSFDCSDVSWSPYVYNEAYVGVTDNKGATGYCTSKIYVVDNLPPVITCPEDDTIPNTLSVNYAITSPFLNANPATAVDGCESVTISHNAPAKLPINVYNPYIPSPTAYWHTVKWTATDQYGSSSSCVQGIKVVDVDSPVLLCRDTVKAGFGKFEANVLAKMCLKYKHDNLKISKVEIGKTGSGTFYPDWYGVYFDCSYINSYANVTVKATDIAGNEGTCTSVVRLVDAGASCKDSTIILTNDGSITLKSSDVVAGDNPSCAIYGVEFSPTFLTCANQGVNTIDVTIEDQNHNFHTCQSKIEVYTLTAPPTDCGDTVVLHTSFEQSGGESYTFNAPSKNLCAGQAPWNYELSGATVEVGTNAGKFTKLFTPGITNVKMSMYNPYDSSTVVCEKVVAVIDTFPPVVSWQIEDSTVYANPQYCYYYGKVPNVFIPWTITSWSVSATGATTFNHSNLNPNSGGMSYVPFNIGTTTITHTGYDESGQQTSYSYDVTVVDPTLTIPVAECPLGKTTWDGYKWVSISAETINEGTFCSDSVEHTIFSPINFAKYPHCKPYTWSYKVTAGHYVGAPVIAEEDSISEQVSLRDINLIAGNNPSGVENVIKLSVTTNTGNTSSCFYKISNINAAPDFECPEDLIINTNDGGCTATYTLPNPVSAMCDDYVWRYAISGATYYNSGHPANLTPDSSITVELNPGEHTVYIEYNKVGKLLSYCSYKLKVIDATAPKVTCPANYTKNVSSEASCGELIGTCQTQNGFQEKFAPSFLNFTNQNYGVSNEGLSFDGSGSPSFVKLVSTYDYSVETFRHLGSQIRIPVDCNGNFSFNWEYQTAEAGKSYPYLVIPNHTSAPYHLPGYDNNSTAVQSGTYSGTLSNGEHIYIGLNDSYTNAYLKISNFSGTYFQQEAALPVVNENCYYTYTHDTKQEYPIGFNTITHTYNDAHGNTKVCEQEIYIKDIYSPTITCRDTTIYLNKQGIAEITPAAVLVNCGSEKDSISKSYFDCSNIGANAVTVTSYSYSNTLSNTCNATVTIADNIAPKVVFKKFTLTLDGNNQGSVPYTDLLNSVGDNCGIDTVTISPDMFTCSDFGNKDVTITATDLSGNQTSVAGVVFVQPTGFTINKQPLNDVVCEGGEVTLSVDVTGNTGLQWEINEQKWSSLNDGSMPSQVNDRSSVAVGGGNVYVAYASGGQTKVKIWNGSSWSDLGSSFSSDGYINIVYSNGKPCIFYASGDYINFRAFDGTDWTNHIQIYTESGFTATNLYAVAEPNNPQIMVAYRSNSTQWLWARYLYYNSSTGNFSLLGNINSSGDATNSQFSVAAIDNNYYWIFTKQNGKIDIKETSGIRSWTDIVTGSSPVIAFAHEQTPFPNTQVPYIAYKSGGNIVVQKYSNNNWVQLGNSIPTNYTFNSLGIIFADTVPMLFYSENSYSKLHGLKFNGTDWERMDTIENARFRDFERIPLAVSGQEVYTFSTHSNAYKLSPWSSVSGATSDSITVSNLTSDKKYRCKVSSSCGTIASTPASITVKKLPVLSVMDTAMITSGLATFTAQVDTGTVSWYADANSTSVLKTGLTLSDTVESSATYYAEAKLDGCVTERKPVKADVIINTNEIVFIDTICLGEKVEIKLTNPQYGYKYILYGQDSNGADSIITTKSCTNCWNGDMVSLGVYANFNHTQQLKVKVIQVTEDAVILPYSNDYVDFGVADRGYTDALTIESWVYNNPSGTPKFPWASESTYGVDKGGNTIWLWDNGVFRVKGTDPICSVNGPCYPDCEQSCIDMFESGGIPSSEQVWHTLNFPTLDTGWTHIATVAGTNGLYIYYNGILVASDNSPITNLINTRVHDASVVIGRDGRYPESYHWTNSHVGFDEFRIWKTARSQSEVSANMNSCLNGTETGLVHYTNFNNMDADSAYSVKGNNGKLNIQTWLITSKIDGKNICEPTMAEAFTEQKTLTVLQNSGIKSAYSGYGCIGKEFYMTASSDTTLSWYWNETGGTPQAVGDTFRVTISDVIGAIPYGSQNVTAYVQAASVCPRVPVMSTVYGLPEIDSLFNDTSCVKIYADLNEDIYYNSYANWHTYYDQPIGGVETDPWDVLDQTDYIIADTITLYVEANNNGCASDKRYVYKVIPKPLTAPANLRSLSTTATDATVTWHSESNCVYWYSIRYRQKGTSNWKFDYKYDYNFDENSGFDIYGLNPNTEYEWRVAAIYDTDDGSGEVSRLSDFGYFTTGCTNTIIRPVNSDAWATAFNKAIVTWNSITCIDSSVVRYREKGKLGWSFQKNTTSSDSTELSRLTPGVVYEWRVMVYNSGNNTALSEITEFCSGPGTPGGLDAQVSKNQNQVVIANLSWTNDYSTCNIDSVVVRYRPTYTNKWNFKTLPATGGKIRFLVESQTYVWRAIAYKNGINSKISAIDTFSTVNPSVRLASSDDTDNIIEENKVILTDNVLIYPNPFNDMLHISMNMHQSGDIALEFYELSGKLVDRKEFVNMSSGSNIIRYTPLTNTTGVYIMKIISNEDVKVVKLIKE